MSSIFERLFPNNEGRLEGPFRKAIRHLFNGELDLNTLRRGGELMTKYIEARKLKDNTFTLIRSLQNFAGQEGVVVYEYSKRKTLKPSSDLQTHNEFNSKGDIAFIEFPHSATIATEIYPNSSSADLWNLTGGALLLKNPKYSAEFVGPTWSYYHKQKLSNNGFFSAEHGLLVPFMNTNPPGQRRGAIGIKGSGELMLLDEQAKLQVIRDNFSGFSIVSGTSFYLSSEDNSASTELDTMSGEDVSAVSYLISYHDESGLKHFAHLTINMLVSRKQVKELLDLHANMHHWSDYIAVELELNGGGCLVKNKQAINADRRSLQNTIGQDGKVFLLRSDHYFVVLN